MAKKTEYLLGVKTNKSLGSEQFVRDLLEAWCNKLDERLRPERFGLGEPIRHSFAEKGIQAAVTTWVTNGMPVLLKRIKKPKFQVDINWRPDKGLDPRPFPWSCTVWLDFSAGDELALSLFRFLIKHFEPAFGLISTYDDYRDKHFITFRDRVGQTEMFVGVDIGDTLPGIYWTSYFGSWAVNKIGKERFTTLGTEKIELINGGYLVQAYGSGKEIGTLSAREAENKIIDHLGRANFFDKSKVDIEALKIDDETADVIERKIAEMKRR